MRMYSVMTLLIYSEFLARLGGRDLGDPGIQRHRDDRRLCSDAAGGSAAVRAAPQAVAVGAALGASSTTVVIVGY